MKRTVIAICALVALSIPAISQATPPRPGPYFSGFLGVAMPPNTTSNSPNLGISDRVEFDTGINAGGTMGYDFGYMRMEGEVSYKHGEIRSVHDSTGTRFGDMDGRIGALAMLGNLFLDLHNLSPVTPYVGGGLGFAALMQSDTSGVDFTNPGVRTQLYRSDTDAVFAYQVGGGFAVALTRQLSMDLGYRYFATSEATFNRDTIDENRMKFQAHNVSVGLRVKF